ncbi:type II secretion system protein GspK [Kiritimatiellaeota bacterium B1221]|nr:type II secretion system protein GspK [Kiritimatiellaeota bacterium B1221]
MSETSHPSPSRSGAVLIVVMWICLALVSMALYFADAASFSYRGIDNGFAGAQARQALQGAARYALQIIGEREEPKIFPDSEAYVHEQVTVGEASFWFLAGADASSNDAPGFGLVDEASKLNINTASAESLALLPDMTEDFAAAIVDWRDADDDISDNGAEAQSYYLMDPPLTCKNAPFETLDELFLVYGADEDLLLGEDLNRNGVLDPDEDTDGNGTLNPGLLAYLTVYSREPNSLSDGTARINVNQSAEELETLLEETFGEERGAEIARSARGQFDSLIAYFIQSGMTSEEFDQIAHQLTASEEEIEGLVNVNTASATVLACLEGLDESSAKELVLKRSQLDDSPASEAWIVEVLGEDTARELGPFITGRSFQLTADICAVGRRGKGFRRSLFVIDDSGENPQIIYRRDIHGFGWALGKDLYRELAGEENE